ncbi:MAG TPA: SdpI family protein [Anaerolineales bacterium]|jgi:uncharacterized membrane protein|nr:SdpI family protein [Anaerolineales bacterium]HQX16321.1 SdpI family protein [Anaerolineales bacterium]
MSTRTTIFVSVTLIASAVLAGLLLWSRLPDPMPGHWNAAGEIDGYISKFWGVFLLPIISIALTGLFLIIPRIDPLKANIAQFRAAFNWFIVAFVVYILYLYILTLLAALGTLFNMTLMLLPAVGLLFIGIGYLMSGAKRNFFIGIRTPWTLSSDTVWDKTHKLGSRLFMLGGVVTILCAFLGESGIWIMLVAMLGASFVPIVYSYVLYQRETKS